MRHQTESECGCRCALHASLVLDMLRNTSLINKDLFDRLPQVISSKMMSPPSIIMMNISRSWLHQSIWNGRILGLTEVDTSIKLDEWQVENCKLFENLESFKYTPLPSLVSRETYSTSTPLPSLFDMETYSTSRRK